MFLVTNSTYPLDIKYKEEIVLASQEAISSSFFFWKGAISSFFFLNLEIANAIKLLSSCKSDFSL